MKKILLFALILVINFSIYSQTYSVTGQIKDNASNMPIEFCYVHVLNPQDSMLATCVTDNKGYFKIDVKPGQYKFMFEQLGYVSFTTDLTLISADKFLDVFKLLVNENELGEIAITGSSRKNYMEKDIQVLTNDLKTGAANTYDVLGRVKGLSFDRYKNVIRVDNSENIIILVNGVEKDADYVKNIDPKRLLRVEIIRSPSGKYALQGYDAVVNIILNENYVGYDVTFFNNSMINYANNTTPVLPVQFDNLSVNYTNKKVNIYSNYFFYINDFNVENHRVRTYADSTKLYYEPADNDPYNLVLKSQGHNFTVGADYFISPKFTLSYEGSANYTPFKTDEMSSFHQITSSIPNFVGFTAESITKNKHLTINNSLYFIANFNDANNLNISYAFSTYENHQENTSAQNNTVISQLSDNKRLFSTFNAEFNHTFSNKFGLNIGYGNNFKKMDNRFSVVGNSDSDDFGYTDLRNQFYVYFKYQPIDKIGIKIGGATENTLIQHDSFQKPFWIFMPHVDISIKPINMVDITLKYRSKSNYPEISQTNPFEQIIDWQTVSVGNPNLKPANENKISARFNLFQLLTVEPYYNFTNNYIIDVINKRDDGIFESTYENAGKFIRKGLNISLVIPFGKSIFFQNGADIYKEAISYESVTKDLKFWTMNSELIYMNQKYKTVAGLIYQKQLTRVLNWNGYSTYNNDLWAFLIQQPFFKEKLNIMVLYFIPTNFLVDYNQGTYSETNLYTEDSRIEINLIKRLFMFQVTYRFGKGEEVKKIDKNLDLNNEVQQKKLF